VKGSFATSPKPSPGATGSLSPDLIEQARKDLLAEATLILTRMQQDCEAICRGEGMARLETLFRDMHSYKSLTAFAGLEASSDFAAELENLLAVLWHRRLALDPDTSRLLQQGLSALKAIHGSSATAPPHPEHKMLVAELRAALAKGTTAPTVESAPRHTSARPEKRISPAEASPGLSGSAESANSDLETIDPVASTLSHLLQQFQYIMDKFCDEKASVPSKADTANPRRHFGPTLEQRRMSLRSFFLPMIPAVQKIAARHGKRIQVHLDLENQEVDSSRLRALHSSIVHVLRNAVAHGIEGPEERLAAGKHDTGSITISAKRQGSILRIVISDDGHGFNSRALRAAAVKVGAISQEKVSLTAEDVTHLAFLPGVSTSPLEDDLSGRGMGLTAVSQDVTTAGGRVVIESRPGAGTSIALEIPVS